MVLIKLYSRVFLWTSSHYQELGLHVKMQEYYTWCVTTQNVEMWKFLTFCVDSGANVEIFYILRLASTQNEEIYFFEMLRRYMVNINAKRTKVVSFFSISVCGCSTLYVSPWNVEKFPLLYVVVCLPMKCRKFSISVCGCSMSPHEM